MSLSSAVIHQGSGVTALDSLGRLLGRIGTELDDVAARLGRLTFAGSAGPDAGLSSHELTALQDIDLAYQVLQSIAAVMRRAALSEAAAAPIDVERLAEGLPLESMTRLVTGRTDHRKEGGELDLF